VNSLDIEDLIGRLEKELSKTDKELLQSVYAFAAKAHKGQHRISGEPYITHPLAVANILIDLELDIVTIASAILHDVVEDTSVTIEDIKQNFGDEIALLVDGVTKLSKLEYKSKEEEQVENLRKMFLAMAKDIRVILIKLSDRLHNMRTLSSHKISKQKEIAEETIEIFAPLAHRLGIFKVKWELEDLSLRYLESEKYYELVKGINKKRAEREEYINQVIILLRDKLDNVEIRADIEGRPKHFFSIYKKMTDQGKNLNEIYDLIAVRVMVDSVKDCYGALGIVHTLWKPIPGRFKDYIAMPKSNMYQSLHTTVVGPQGEPFEIQIRTWEMHKTAEYGIAAHWRYKEGKGDEKLEGKMDEKLVWLRQLLEWQKDLGDAREFMENLKIDLFVDVVFVFTPKGDVIELPAGSNPIDFAYRIHTDIGHRCIGAKVNGKIVPLDYKLKNGDIMSILTSRQTNGPSRDWLKTVQTSQAKNRIRAWFKKENKTENITKGKEAIERESKKNGLDLGDLSKNEHVLEAVKRYNFSSLDDLFAAVGDGVVTPNQIMAKLREDDRKEKRVISQTDINNLIAESKQKKKKKKDNGIIVAGLDNGLVRLAGCCNPVPGDQIIGFITRGRGVTIHQRDCVNMKYHLKVEVERIIPAAWDTDQINSFQVKVEVHAKDRPGLLTDVMVILVEINISANDVHARGTKNGKAVIELLIDVESLEQLDYIMKRINNVSEVYDVYRVTQAN